MSTRRTKSEFFPDESFLQDLIVWFFGLERLFEEDYGFSVGRERVVPDRALQSHIGLLIMALLQPRLGRTTKTHVNDSRII
jgi:hypothetical protein